MKSVKNVKPDIHLSGTSVRLNKLIAESIDESNYEIKIFARNSLVRMGNSIVPHLHKLFSSENGLLRQEAAKIVALIASRRSIASLIDLLDDKEFDIRWIAAEGLIKIGRHSIRPLLRSVRDGKSSLSHNRGAHHVLNGLLHENEKQRLKLLMQSLDNYHIYGEVSPTEASKALKTLFKCNN